MKYLIAGFGSIGRRHFRNLFALGERDFVFLRSNQSTLADDEISDYPSETDLSKALSHKPDVVIVSNPTSMHLDVAIPAAEAGCHLFLEKPLSNSMERINKLQSSVERGGGQVLIGFQFRYHPHLLIIQDVISRGAVGNCISVRVQWGEYLPDWHPWEDYRVGYSARKDLGGGVVLTLCHPLDYVRWLLGEVSNLWAFTSPVEELGIDVDGVAEIGLGFRNGVIGNIHLDYVQRPPRHNLEIVGSEGRVLWDYHTGDLRIFNHAKDKPEIIGLPEGFERNQMFEDQMQHLISVVNGDEKPRCSLGDGIRVQQLAAAVYESSQEKKIIQC